MAFIIFRGKFRKILTINRLIVKTTLSADLIAVFKPCWVNHFTSIADCHLFCCKKALFRPFLILDFVFYTFRNLFRLPQLYRIKLKPQ